MPRGQGRRLARFFQRVTVNSHNFLLWNVKSSPVREPLPAPDDAIITARAPGTAIAEDSAQPTAPIEKGGDTTFPVCDTPHQ